MRRYPRSYHEAHRMLRRLRRTAVQVHDDLVLREVQGGIAVYFRQRRIVMFHNNANTIDLDAAVDGERTDQCVVHHIARFTPRGFRLKYNRNGRMLLHTPNGTTRLVMRHRIVLAEDFDPF